MALLAASPRKSTQHKSTTPDSHYEWPRDRGHVTGAGELEATTSARAEVVAELEAKRSG